ncbi:MAG: GNAT family N-acetyltransferase [Arenicella sp.]|nr:GNAT family N-acetyltransferase [Arenicella sp.]MBT8346443.1 GNAT family N-acetyltransferase [Desulfofustis sp.]NNF46315.1 GNAT family N-acetyltransferase [Desulfofustis sp.]NNK56403.1 GNAT family N-acetyltransferase [Desulfofustis sp.]
MNIRPLHHNDIEKTAKIHEAAFVRQKLSYEWIESNSKAYPRVQYYVAENQNNEIVGYIQWVQKSGFRQEVVLEMEQLAVLPEYHGKGIGSKLIKESLPQINCQLAGRGAKIKHIIVTTRSDNYAQKIYQKTIGATVEATIRDLYSADEVLMVARNVELST